MGKKGNNSKKAPFNSKDYSSHFLLVIILLISLSNLTDNSMIAS